MKILFCPQDPASRELGGSRTGSGLSLVRFVGMMFLILRSASALSGSNPGPGFTF